MKKHYQGHSVLTMLRGIKSLQFSISLLLIFILIGCPIPNNPAESDEDVNTGEVVNTEEELDTEEDVDIENHLLNIEGTWQDTESSRSFTINSLHVLFQYPNPVPPGDIVAYGNFRYVSYDGTTVSINDYDDEVVSFTATIENNILTVSGLNAIKIFDDPFDRRDYRSWNTTYTK
ncbi:MAG: hypothetical protein JEY99_15255 [Spirochaetales bacterium]|nr:hypothetical protein [Spirochaetales bacterium]